MLKELIGYSNNSLARYKIEYREFNTLQKLALRHLGLDNMNQLRDRFEGQAYFDSFLLRSYAEIALENYLKDDFIDYEKKKNKNYRPLFKIKEESLELIYSDLNSYPLIPKGDYKYGVLVLVNLSNRETYIQGFITKEELILNTYNTGLSPLLDQTYYGYLKDFKILSNFNSSN